MVVCQIWLEQQFIYNGKRRNRRWGMGHQSDMMYGYFMKRTVGISQRVLTGNNLFTTTSSYLKELFPEFLSHNPFEEPDYFAFPFEHVTLDQMVLVYMCHERMDMLRYSEKRRMNYWDFSNWAVNHVLSYNDDIGEDVYYLATVDHMMPIIRSKKYNRFDGRDNLFNFENHGTKN